MFKLLVAITSVLSVAAFAPASRMAGSSALRMGYENELGAIPPVGFWDPLKLSEKIDQETFNKYRTAEIKHGRVAQLAVVGLLWQSFYKFPGEIAEGITFESIPNGVQAISAVPALGWLQILAVIGYVDTSLSQGKTPVPFAFTPQPFGTEEGKVKAQVQEISHGRAAMLGVLELFRENLEGLARGEAFDPVALSSGF